MIRYLVIADSIKKVREYLAEMGYGPLNVLHKGSLNLSTFSVGGSEYVWVNPCAEKIPNSLKGLTFDSVIWLDNTKFCDPVVADFLFAQFRGYKSERSEIKKEITQLRKRIDELEGKL